MTQSMRRWMGIGVVGMSVALMAGSLFAPPLWAATDTSGGSLATLDASVRAGDIVTLQADRLVRATAGDQPAGVVDAADTLPLVTEGPVRVAVSMDGGAIQPNDPLTLSGAGESNGRR